MRRTDQEPSTTTGPPRTPSDPAAEVYQPPQVAWEEDFAPMAASDPVPCPGGDPDHC